MQGGEPRYIDCWSCITISLVKLLRRVPSVESRLQDHGVKALGDILTQIECHLKRVVLAVMPSLMVHRHCNGPEPGQGQGPGPRTTSFYIKHSLYTKYREWEWGLISPVLVPVPCSVYEPLPQGKFLR